MANHGRIIAGDIYEHKLALIKSNVNRLGINIVETRLQDASVQAPDLVGIADRVLVDAPCSGLGVLGKRPEARWSKEEKKLSQFPPLQKKILANAATYVKPGGYLVYSTCTLEQDENTRVVAAFLKEHPDFGKVAFPHPLTGEMIDELQLLPQRDDIDGFYICLMQKK
jgi:16S rRNA (cytosine967-C5)-methyltransferase